MFPIIIEHIEHTNLVQQNGRVLYIVACCMGRSQGLTVQHIPYRMASGAIYRRVRIKRPWVGSLRIQLKRRVGTKCVAWCKWHSVSAHNPEKAEIFDKSHFLL